MTGRPSLRDLQRWMKARIQPDAARADLPEGLPVLNDQRGTPGVERLHVYAEGYVTRIQQALAEVYAAVRYVLGERAFRELAEGYAARYPSHDFSLTLAGRHLPEFLNGWPRTAQLPFLPDLARLEWKICQAFHAFEEPPVALSALTQLSPADWESARLTFQPSVGVIASAWPILDLWTARAAPRESLDLELTGRPQQVAVFRRGVETHAMPLDAAQYQLLRDLLDGQTLGQACGRLAQEGADLPLADWFAEWAAAGWIIRLDTGAEPQD